MPERYGEQATAADTWKSFAELVGNPSIPVVMTEAFIAAVTNSAYLRIQPFRPATGDVGAVVNADGAAGLGPVSPLSGYPLQEVWVRNVSAGSDAVVVVTGVKV